MSYTLDQEQATLYNKGGTSDDYSIISGAFVIPLAIESSSSQTPVVVVRAHSDYKVRTVKFSYTKQMNPPLLPKAEDIGTYQLLGGAYSFPAPTPNISGGFEWSGSGYLTYVNSVHATASDGFVLSAVPFIYQIQGTNTTAGSISDSAPLDVQSAGLGPKTGWTTGQFVSLTNPGYMYSEPSFYPGVFFSSDLLNGPSSYPAF